MTKQQAKKIFKISLLIYFASFLIINWTDIAWVFNYRTVSVLVNDFFNPYPGIDASSINTYFYPNQNQQKSTQTQENTVIESAKFSYTDKLNELEIPKLGISAPMVFSTSTDVNKLTKDLDSGLVYYPGSVKPGEKGNIIVLGHSAPVGWPKIKYDWVFSDLNNLVSGDTVLISLNNKQYKYIVRKKVIIEKGEELPDDNSNTEKSFLTLISCWPPGKDYQRIAVLAELEN